jgi:TPR repeat protein
MLGRWGVLGALKAGLAVAAMAVASATAAGDFEEALAAAESGDYKKAYFLWRMVALEGNDAAQFNLGQMHYRGEGVPQDYKEAAAWYQRAAERGSRNAAFMLGYMHSKGEGVPQDFGAALKWYRYAAERGDAAAQTNLGLMYFRGDGTTQDFVEAHTWANLGAANMPPDADRKRAVDARDAIAERMTPQQIAEAQRLAREFRPKK